MNAVINTWKFYICYCYSISCMNHHYMFVL